MTPQAGRVGDGVVSEGSKAFDELEIGDDTSLRKAVHATPNFNVDVPIVGERQKVVLSDDFFWEDVDGKSHVLVPFHGRAKIIIF